MKELTLEEMKEINGGDSIECISSALAFLGACGASATNPFAWYTVGATALLVYRYCW